MAILPNIFFDTMRSQYTALQGSGAPTLFLQNQEGHIQPAAARHLSINAVSAVKVGYTVRVDPGMDIRVGDFLTNIIEIKTGQAWISDDGTQTWNVIDALEATPGILSYRMVVLTRAIFGGPAPL